MNAAEIAKGLTQPDADIVLSVNSLNEQMMGGPASALRFSHRDLVELVGINHPIFGGHWRLSTLGLEVRAILEGEAA
jgi:hypothetical protein